MSAPRYTTAPSRAGEELGIDPPRPRGDRAVMSQRSEAPDSLDDFPTPPWATRALCQIVLPKLGLSLEGACVWEPACGRGIMAEVLKEYAAMVWASDVHAYPEYETAVGSFVGVGVDVIPRPPAGHDGCAEYFDAIITNPPFRLAVEFFERAITEADVVALLLRSNWAEGGERYERVFSKHQPLAVAQFCERVPMVKGRWDPDASTATSYAWFVWVRGASVGTQMIWIPPGQRAALERADDRERFAGPKQEGML